MKVHGVLTAVALAAALLCGGATLRADEGATGGAPPAAAARSIEDLIRDLGSDDFKTREEATEALGERGAEAIPALERATKDKDPEVRWRAEKALKAARAKAEGRKLGDGERAPERTTPGRTVDPLDPLEQLREAEERIRRLNPELDELLKGLKLDERLPRELGRIFDDMQRRLRELDAPRRDTAPFREFWSFRYKDGRWEVERSSDPVDDKVGLRTQPVPPVARAQLGLEGPAGVAIEEVRAGSIADRAGLDRWDILLEVDGEPVENDAALEALAEPGEHTITFIRKGKRETRTVVVEGELRKY